MYLDIQSAERRAIRQTDCSRDRAGRGKQKGCRTRISGSSGSSSPSYGPVAAELHPYSRVPEPVHQNLLLFLFMLLAMLRGAELGVCKLPIDSDEISAKLAAHDGQFPYQSSADLKRFASQRSTWIGLVTAVDEVGVSGLKKPTAGAPGPKRGKIKEMIVIDGILYAIGSVVGGLLTAWLTGLPLTALPFFVFAVFCLYFFRDPDRNVPQGPFVVSPADGKVMAVKPEGPDTTRVTIFLNIFDVHVNRSPVAGVIQNVEYRRGQFLVASKEIASVENEQNIVTMRTTDGITLQYKQIAGLIARRIVFRKHVGDTVAAGERIGLMKFGSRMDVLLGPEWKILVQPGQRVSAGSDILAERV